MEAINPSIVETLIHAWSEKSSKLIGEEKQVSEPVKSSTITLLYNEYEHNIVQETSKKVKFEPLLYLQRYDYVKNILIKYDCKTYMDIGCAECKLLRYIKVRRNRNM